MGDFDFIAYFRQIAFTLKDILHSIEDPHFSRVNSITELGEFLANMRTAEGYQLIVIDNVSGRFIDRRSDNLMVMPYYSWYLVKQVSREDFDEKEQSIKDCMKVVKKILARMFRDKINYRNNLENLDRDSITYNQAGPFGHNWYGLNVNFTMQDSPDINFDPDDWEDGGETVPLLTDEKTMILSESGKWITV